MFAKSLSQTKVTAPKWYRPGPADSSPLARAVQAPVHSMLMLREGDCRLPLKCGFKNSAANRLGCAKRRRDLIGSRLPDHADDALGPAAGDLEVDAITPSSAELAAVHMFCKVCNLLPQTGFALESWMDTITGACTKPFPRYSTMRRGFSHLKIRELRTTSSGSFMTGSIKC